MDSSGESRLRRGPGFVLLALLAFIPSLISSSLPKIRGEGEGEGGGEGGSGTLP